MTLFITCIFLVQTGAPSWAYMLAVAVWFGHLAFYCK